MSVSSSTESPIPPRRYAHPAGLFTLLIPTGWSVNDAGGPGTEVILFSPCIGYGGFRPNINVVVQDLRGLTPEEFLTLTRLHLKQMTSQQQPQRDEPFPAVPSARLLEWSAPLGGLLLTVCQMLVTSGAYAFIVTGTVPAANLPEYRDTIQAAFASFTPGNPASGPAAGAP